MTNFYFFYENQRHFRAVVGLGKVIRPLNAIGVPRGPKARAGESTRGGHTPSRKGGGGGGSGVLSREFDFNLTCLLKRFKCILRPVLLVKFS